MTSSQGVINIILSISHTGVKFCRSTNEVSKLDLYILVVYVGFPCKYTGWLNKRLLRLIASIFKKLQLFCMIFRVAFGRDVRNRLFLVLFHLRSVFEKTRFGSELVLLGSV